MVKLILNAAVDHIYRGWIAAPANPRHTRYRLERPVPLCIHLCIVPPGQSRYFRRRLFFELSQLFATVGGGIP